MAVVLVIEDPGNRTERTREEPKRSCKGRKPVMRKSGIGSLENKRGVWLARWTVCGKRYSRSTGVKVDGGEKARREAESILKEFTASYSDRNEKIILERQVARLHGIDKEIAEKDGKRPSITLTAGWEVYKRSQSRPRSGDGTLRNYQLTYGQFVEWMTNEHPDITELRAVDRRIASEYAAYLIAGTDKDTAKEITECRAWVRREARQRKRGRPLRLTDDEIAALGWTRAMAARQIRKPIRGNTFNKHLNALSLIWRHVARDPESRITVNPWAYNDETGEGIRRIKLTHEERPHSRRALTIDEVQKVIQKASGELRALIAIGFYTGMRLGDCSTLKWENFNFEKGVISKRSRKTDTETHPTIHPTLMRILDETVGRKTIGYVLPKTAKDYLESRSKRVMISNDITRLFESVGIHTKVEEDGKRCQNDCGFHSLRHTFVTLIRNGGTALRTAQELAGHHTAAMTEHYTHDDARAVLSLPDITGNGDPFTSVTTSESSVSRVVNHENSTSTLSVDLLRKAIAGLTAEEKLKVLGL